MRGARPPRAAALKDGRRLGPGLVLLDAEVNVVRRLVEPGAPVRHAWDDGVARAGVAGSDLAAALVLNPAPHAERLVRPRQARRPASLPGPAPRDVPRFPSATAASEDGR